MKEILLTSSVLIGVVMALRRLLRGKVQQKLLYAAWLLVALRLLVPVQFGQWSFSLNTLTETVTEHSPTIQQAQQVLTTPVAGPSKEEVRQQLTQQYQEQGLDLKAPEVQVQLEAQVEAKKTALTLSEILKIIWLSGTGIMALWFLLTNLIFLHRAKIHSQVLDTDAPVQVRVSDGVPTPCLVGLFRPVIYVTPDCTEDPQMLHHVLTHEIAHWRQWDPVWSLVRCVCLCIYWFNPLVWVAAAQSRRDCELSCDEAALKQLGDNERIAYGKTLLAMIRASSAPSELLKTATSMNESKKQLKERMCFIVKKPRNIVFAAIAMMLVIALAAGCAFTGSKQSEETPPTSEQTPIEPTTEPTAPTETEPTTTPPEQTDAPLIPNPHSLFPTASPVMQTEAPTEAQLIAKEVLTGRYFDYFVYGVCCDFGPDLGYVDMSQYLTEEQQEDYHNYQIPITCCKTAAEVQAHIDRYVGKDAQYRSKLGYPMDKLFTDDEGQLYLIVTPTEHDRLRHFEVISQTKDTIVVRACLRDEDSCWMSQIYTIKSTANGYVVANKEDDREYKCEITTLHEEPDFQLYQYGNTGYGGAVYSKQAGTLYFMEEFYCPAITQVAENIWEITTDYGNGFVRRIYYGLSPNSGHPTYDYAIALGHGKIAYLDGELNRRTLVVCDLFDKTTSQTFTELDFKAENMPVTAAAFSENDTQLTLTYYNDQNAEATITLGLTP